MFNKVYNVRTGGGHTSVTSTVTENRAPTDDSVALLREMEADARDSILDGILVQGNGFEAVLVEVAATNRFARTELRYAFKLNGELYQGIIPGVSDTSMYFRDTAVEGIKVMMEQLSKVIAQQLMEKAIKETFSRWAK